MFSQTSLNHTTPSHPGPLSHPGTGDTYRQGAGQACGPAHGVPSGGGGTSKSHGELKGFCVTWKPASIHDVLVFPGSVTLHRAWALVLEPERGRAPVKREPNYSSLTP